MLGGRPKQLRTRCRLNPRWSQQVGSSIGGIQINRHELPKWCVDLVRGIGGGIAKALSISDRRGKTLFGRLLVDMHMHMYESKAQGQRRKDASPIVEYGAMKSVATSPRAGDLADALAAMREAAFSYAIVLNLLYTLPSDQGVLEKAPGSTNGDSVLHDPASARDRLTAYNHWVCELSRTYPQFVAFISLDPWVMSPDEMCTHLRDMVSQFNARGLKLHPIAQRFAADDERMWPVYRTCADLGVPVLAVGYTKSVEFDIALAKGH
jgi:predicted TIM-barrel fold metal-dependent hydrolase